MDKSQIIALYNQEQRINMEYPGMRREITQHVVRHIDTSEVGEGIVSYSRINEANAEAIIREQVSYFESIGQDFEWKLFDYDQPPDLKQKLASFGFNVEEVEAVMVLDVKTAPNIVWQPTRHTVKQITDPEKLVDIQSIEEQVWNEDSFWVLELLGDTLRDDPEQISVYAAYVDEQPVSAGWINFPKNSQFASLWGGATISRFRNQGLFTALLAARAQEAKARGVAYLTVDAMPMSRPILEKLGFETIAYSFPCKWKRKS